jgi:hypothetical protein
MIAARLRAIPVPPSELRKATLLLLIKLKGTGSVDAMSVIDAAQRAKIPLAFADSRESGFGASLAKDPAGLGVNAAR